MIYVIGSGPSGVSCASALVKKGLMVTMLDAGVDLEQDHRAAVNRLRNLPYESWDSQTIQQFTQDTKSNISGIPMKKTYGSDFPFQKVDDFFQLHTQGTDCFPTLAKGGFSNIWGANVLPYRAEDIGDWPISISNLEEHYRAVFKLMDLAAKPDDLTDLFPTYTNQFQSLNEGVQAKSFLNDLTQNRKPLRSDGFFFGHSRLAVRAYDSSDGPGCVYCGLCMYGCPHELIYNSSVTLKKLMQFQNFQYRDGVAVIRLTESKDGVTISGQSLTRADHFEFKAERVYLACGPISTSRILLESMDQHHLSVTLKDSQYFLIPCLRFHGNAKVQQERLHTLSQVYLELIDRKLSPHTIHLQCYMFNDLYLKAIKNLLGPTYVLFQRLAGSILSRLTVIQGYLHSSHSSEIKLWLEKTKEGKTRTMVKASLNQETKQMVSKILKKIWKHKNHFKMIPLTPFVNMAKPGRGYHSGGSFPMRLKPTRLESDLLGRPYGFERVHAVDSTIFPSIPATTITLTSMANAHRIASAYEQT